MTDTLKFRAWLLRNKCYVDVFAIDFRNEEIYEDLIVYEDTHHFEHIILEQYTGLKDINGVEIFEGDILRFKIDMSELGLGIQTNLIEVKELETIAHIFTVLSNGAELEVIGNIHENSDMLKGDK